LQARVLRNERHWVGDGQRITTAHHSLHASGAVGESHSRVSSLKLDGDGESIRLVLLLINAIDQLCLDTRRRREYGTKGLVQGHQLDAVGRCLCLGKAHKHS
jgi:hypothetical protein